MSEGDLTVIYVAPDQTSAYAIQSLLESENIRVILLDERSTWGGMAQGGHPEFYCKIAVLPEAVQKAMQILLAFEEKTNRRKKPDATPYTDKRYSPILLKVFCAIGILLSACITEYTCRTGFDRLSLVVGVYSIMIGLLSIGHVVTAPRRFRKIILWYTIAHFPIGITLYLGFAQNYYSWSLISILAFRLLGWLSVFLFVIAVLQKIPKESTEPRE